MTQQAIPNKLSLFLLQVSRPYWLYLSGMLSVGIYAALHNAIQPYVLKELIDKATASIGKENFIAVSMLPAIILIAMSFIITFIWRLYNYFNLKSVPLMKADIINLTTRHLRGQSFTFFQNNLSGAVSAKVGDLANNVQMLVHDGGNFIRQCLTILISIIMSFFIHPYFAIAFSLWALLFVGLAYYCSKSIQIFSQNYAESRSKNFGNIVDCFTNASSMLLFGREEYEDKYLQNSLGDTILKEQEKDWKTIKNASMLGGMAVVMQISSIILLLYLGTKGLITAGDFAFIFIISITIIDQVWFLTENLDTCAEHVGICQQALQILSKEHEQKILIDAKPLKVDKGTITFNKVHFKYVEGKNFFQDKTLIIQGREKVGLVGYSGSGKSTFVNLITRLFDVQQGEILIDDQPIQKVTLKSLRDNIGFIPQDPNLFHRSLMENIRYGKIDASDEEVIKAAKNAHAHEFISELRNGYSTLVGERGIKLSGGQRQRVAIARAILKNAPILILDEATSSLDSVTEGLIQESLNYAMKNKTVIVIAHRLSTVLSMDRILVFERGQIVEAGTHQELISTGGFYKQLWDVQKGHSYIG